MQRWFIETTYPQKHEILSVYRQVDALADANRIARLTIADLAKHANLHANVVSSSLSIMASQGVLDRDLDIPKLAKIKILKEHPGESYSELFSSIESLGFLSGEFYDVNLEFLAENKGIKMPALLKDLKMLDKEDYIIFVPS